MIKSLSLRSSSYQQKMYEYVCKLDKWADKRVTRCDMFCANKISNFFPIAFRSPKYQTPTWVFFFLGNVILRSRHCCSSNSNVITNVSSGKRASRKRRKRVFPKKMTDVTSVKLFSPLSPALIFFIVAGIRNHSIFVLYYKEKKERRGKRIKITRLLNWWDRSNLLKLIFTLENFFKYSYFTIVYNSHKNLPFKTGEARFLDWL